MVKLLLKIVKLLLILCFRVEVKGAENFKKLGARAVILSNHQSFLDPVLLAAFLPEKPSFAINTHIARLPFVRPVLFMFNVFKIDPTNPLSLKSLIDYVRQDKKVVIFSEGRITVTGSLMKVYEGPGMVAQKADAMVLPVHIDNAQYTIFSRLKGKVRRKLFPKIKITILPPVKIEPHSSGREARAETANYLQNLLSESQFKASHYNQPIMASVLDTVQLLGRKKIVAEDMKRKPMNYKTLLLKSYVLSTQFKNLAGTNIGVLLPNSLANLVSFFALHNAGKVPAMINFSAGAANINNAIKTAGIETIICSHEFVEKAELGELIKNISGANIIYLEDIAKNIGTSAKLGGLVLSLLPKLAFAKALRADANMPAVILFTSGSEGVPKGVVLSHANITANLRQAQSVIDFSTRDVVLNVLPMFHSFGLTVGTLLPVMCGLKVFLYPSPLHYHIIPEISYAIQATMLFGTDTFLSRYGKYAHQYDFFSVRYVLAGAEKLKESTRQLWADKFGIRIFEGYGVTETSPVLSVNTPLFNKIGTVGRLLPAIERKLVPVEGITQGAELYVKGPNIMQGYLKLDKPGVLQPPPDGWYATGDIVTIDGEGFITIVGRAKRFAKIAGEMVSLPMVEEFVGKVWPAEPAAVVAVKDDKKGEQIVVVVENKNLALEELKNKASDYGLPEIALPRRLLNMPIPLLGSGKIDYPALQKAVEAVN
jgi:acyl-[acyl-carrier-protein]-phospholipid O-acyltransferase/long-chain-fatty-acid--[acyl-carrier-protein] ligase